MQVLDTIYRRAVAAIRAPGDLPCIYGTAFVMAMAINLVNLGMVFHGRETLGLSATRVGWLPSTFSITYFLACLLLVPHLQHHSPRRLVAFSLGCLTVCFLAISLVSHYGLLLLLCASYGISLSLFWPLMMGWLSIGREGGRLGRALSHYNFSWCAGSVLGPYICGALSEAGTRLPLLAGTALTGCSLFLVLYTPRAASGTRQEGMAPGTDTGKTTTGRSTRLRYPAWLGLAVSFFGMGVLRASFPVGAREELGFSLVGVGLLLFVAAFSNMIAFLVLGFTERWHFRLSPMLGGQVLGALAFGGLLFATRPATVALLLACVGISAAFAYTYSVFHGVSGAARRSGRMAIHEAMLSFGMFAGAAGGAMIYDTFNLSAVFAVTSLLLIGSIMAQMGLGLYAARADRRPSRNTAGGASVRDESVGAG